MRKIFTRPDSTVSLLISVYLLLINRNTVLSSLEEFMNMGSEAFSWEGLEQWQTQVVKMHCNKQRLV